MSCANRSPKPLLRAREVPGGRLTWAQLQQLVALHLEGRGARGVARELGIGPNTERRYRRALGSAGLMSRVPSEAQLRAALAEHLPHERRPQHRSSLEPWLDTVRALVEQGGTPKTIHGELVRRAGGSAPGSLSAVKRMCLRIYEENRQARLLDRARMNAHAA